MSEISREVLTGVGPDGIDVREYSDNQDVKLPSVTTVLQTRDDDKSNLYAWQDRNDGEGDNAHHEHLFWYKRHRGTLCHFYALEQLDPTLEWSDDEQQSEDEIVRQIESEVVGDHSREILYSVLKDQNSVDSWGDFYDKHSPYSEIDHFTQELRRQCERDIDYFLQAFDEICTQLNVGPDDTIAVEKFLFNEQDGYAGQVDLVYECPQTGDTVVADLKTSSGCYDKHKIQGAAYGRSVEILMDLDVDRLEVWRIHPDTGQWAVHCDDEPTEIHTSDWWDDDYRTLLDQFLELSDAFEYDSPDDYQDTTA